MIKNFFSLLVIEICNDFVLVFNIVVLLNDVDDWRGGMEVWILVGYFELSLDDWIELVDMFLDNLFVVVEVDFFLWLLVIFFVNVRLK